jgi:hypothetical protein
MLSLFCTELKFVVASLVTSSVVQHVIKDHLLGRPGMRQYSVGRNVVLVNEIMCDSDIAITFELQKSHGQLSKLQRSVVPGCKMWMHVINRLQNRSISEIL